MGNWNYSNGNGVDLKIGKYVQQHVDLKSRGKHSGITYDLRDSFIELVDQGKLVDLKGDGFTKKDALNLYKELDKIHTERKLNKNYTKMDAHSKFDYSEEEVRRLANAAGYQVKVEKKYYNSTDHTGVAPKPVYTPIKRKTVSTNVKTNKNNNAPKTKNNSSISQFFSNMATSFKNAFRK